MTGHPLIPADLLSSAVSHFPGLGAWVGVRRNGLSVNAPTCLFATTTGTWFTKLESLADRSEDDLRLEHHIVNHLHGQGFPTPAVQPTTEGRTWMPVGDQRLVITALAAGEDRYGAAPVFASFGSRQEAREAGRRLAHLHRLAPDLPPGSARPWRGMTAQCQLLADVDADATLARWRRDQPALTARFDEPGVQDRFRRYLEARLAEVAQSASPWPTGVIHGDFIKRNLFWDGDRIVAVIDFGLWNVGPWLLDLALAMIPCGFDWPELLAGRGEVRVADLQAMVAGYDEVRPLDDGERASLQHLLPLARLEFYLGIVAAADARQDRHTAQRFWELLLATMAWFDAHPRALEGL